MGAICSAEDIYAMEAIYVATRYVCPFTFCQYPLEDIDFDEMEIICGGKNKRCPGCGNVLWIPCAPMCGHCLKSLEKITFSWEEFKAGGKNVICPGCGQDNWVYPNQYASSPMLIFN